MDELAEIAYRILESDCDPLATVLYNLMLMSQEAKDGQSQGIT
jgi:hypothetical protein